jgi:D-alanyl-D-alanine carboxypeptidase/D-alanyl-D-alanine-endopeptidase (penicillin-binding protein 4)
MTPNRLRPAAIALALFPALAACASGAAAPSPPAPAPAGPPIAAALEAVFNDTMFAGAFWGVDVRSQATGEILYQRNPGKMLVPASNMKIVTGAAALEELGPDYRYRTADAATGPIAGGELRGDLVVVGSGDPTISAQFGGDPRAVFRAWADSLRARGVTRITGRVVGDDNAFDDVPLGAGWSWDDVNDYYSAEISALELNEGIVGVRVRPGASPGAPAMVTLDPPTAYVPVRSTVTTGAPGSAPRVDAVREPLGPGIVVSGQLAADTTAVTTEVAVRNNTAYFATVLRETLAAAGIAVRGEAVDMDSLPAAPARTDTLFVHRSPPMPEILAAVMKPSQNQIGELLLKTLGRELRGAGTARAGIAVVDSLARTWGLPARRLSQADGSGLSRYNLVAPEFLIALLRHMERSPNRDVFVASLPVAGVDGTLASRMRGTPLQGNVRAKTGTVSNVRALSGYMTTAAGEPIVFSIIVNHHTLSARDADRLAEAALMRIHAMPRNR